MLVYQGLKPHQELAGSTSLLAIIETTVVMFGRQFMLSSTGIHAGEELIQRSRPPLASSEETARLIPPVRWEGPW